MYDGHVFGFGGVIMWLFWILLIVVIVWIVKAAMGSGENRIGKGKSALKLLQERYARGEIDREEYQQKREDLSN